MGHVFQPYPVEMLDWNPIEMISKEWFALTTEADGKVDAMTASWGGIGHIWGKNAVYVFVRDSRYSKELLDKSDYFAVNFFDPKEHGTKNTLKYLGAVSGRDEDKFAGARLTLDHIDNCPVIDEANFILTCRKMAAVPFEPENMLDPEIIPSWYKDGNYHTMYVGEIIEILAR